MRWFDAARETADAMIERFADDERGGFFTTSHDHEELIARRKDVGDHPIPSGNSSAAYGLLRLAALTGERAYEEQAVGVAAAASRRPPRSIPTPSATCSRRSTSTSPPPARSRWSRPARRRRTRRASPSWPAVVRSAHRPHVVLAGGPEGSERPELLRERHAVEGRPAAYVCEHFACKAPVTDPAELAKLLGLER